MKINLDQPILDFKGNPVLIENSKDKDPLTLKSAFFTALSEPALETNAQGQNVPEQLPADQKMRMYKLCNTIINGGEVDLSVEDIAFIKERVGKVFISPLVYGRVSEILEK